MLSNASYGAAALNSYQSVALLLSAVTREPPAASSIASDVFRCPLTLSVQVCNLDLKSNYLVFSI